MSKKHFLIILLLTCFSGFGQVIITRVVDGELTNDGCSGIGTTNSAQVVELYVNGTVNFSGYTVDIEKNGSSTSAESWDTSNISGLNTISNDFVYLVWTSATTFDEMLPGQTRIVITTGNNFNGNDAIRITDGNNVLDQYGNPNTMAGLDYRDSYAQRNNDTNPSSTFDINDWTIFPANTLDTVTTCNALSTLIGFASYTNSVLSTTNLQKSNVKIYVNNVKELEVSGVETSLIEIYDINGRIVTKSKSKKVSVVNLKSGVYIASIKDNKGNKVTKKFIKN